MHIRRLNLILGPNIVNLQYADDLVVYVSGVDLINLAATINEVLCSCRALKSPEQMTMLPRERAFAMAVGTLLSCLEQLKLSIVMDNSSIKHNLHGASNAGASLQTSQRWPGPCCLDEAIHLRIFSSGVHTF
ncbi:unnamed protein product [Leptidea sinapis]|uniref:Uncharacterized protein n=1 Tax=Leptidea sinapis TaxID=189913 RepID=A0A5E4PRZ8_9NEOP|nr:unnamed protein product [Leptidea sinapis]